VLVGPIVNGNLGFSKAYRIATMAVKKKKKGKAPGFRLSQNRGWLPETDET
jgi:hypothetical protein